MPSPELATDVPRTRCSPCSVHANPHATKFTCAPVSPGVRCAFARSHSKLGLIRAVHELGNDKVVRLTESLSTFFLVEVSFVLRSCCGGARKTTKRWLQCASFQEACVDAPRCSFYGESFKKNGRSCVSADYCEVRSVGESRSPGAHGQHMVVRPVSHCQDLKGVP